MNGSAPAKGLSPCDPGSFSRPDIAVVTHADIKWEIDFKEKQIFGEVTLSIDKLSSVNAVLLDTRDLKIIEVYNALDSSPLLFDLEPPIKSLEFYGQKLSIILPSSSNSVKVTIVYSTSGIKNGLQWLSPRQTSGKSHPFVFSQCQPDYCRSILPIQDTPAVKFTYTAEIIHPADLTALMSAVTRKECSKPCGNIVVDQSVKCTCFAQTVPIPAYLIAIAVGDITCRQIGERTSVWAEPDLIEMATYEFAETDLLLKTAEEICGEYVWKIYDILVLPTSFPFGGMENPCLTFITPTLIAGDRSLVSTISHEISHSWTGNLVTNANFEHFWLNEGFTMFIERKITGRLHGEAARHFSALKGLADLKLEIDNLGKDNPLTKLVVDLKNISPDDAFSTCPYEKGHTFLFYLETMAGGPDVFEPFLRSYLEKFKYKSIKTEDFKEFLFEYFVDCDWPKQVDWEAWLYTPGMPYIIPNYDKSLQNACVQLCEKWCKAADDDSSAFVKEDVAALSTPQLIMVLALLLDAEPLSIDKLRRIAQLCDFDTSKNYEIKSRWLRICINAKWEEKVDEALKFVSDQGRMKYVRPIYRGLYAWEEVRTRALQQYEADKDQMMDVLRTQLKRDLKLQE